MCRVKHIQIHCYFLQKISGIPKDVLPYFSFLEIFCVNDWDQKPVFSFWRQLWSFDCLLGCWFVSLLIKFSDAAERGRLARICTPVMKETEEKIQVVFAITFPDETQCEIR